MWKEFINLEFCEDDDLLSRCLALPFCSTEHTLPRMWILNKMEGFGTVDRSAKIREGQWLALTSLLAMTWWGGCFLKGTFSFFLPKLQACIVAYLCLLLLLGSSAS